MSNITQSKRWIKHNCTLYFFNASGRLFGPRTDLRDLHRITYTIRVHGATRDNDPCGLHPHVKIRMRAKSMKFEWYQQIKMKNQIQISLAMLEVFAVSNLVRVLSAAPLAPFDVCFPRFPATVRERRRGRPGTEPRRGGCGKAGDARGKRGKCACALGAYRSTCAPYPPRADYIKRWRILQSHIHPPCETCVSKISHLAATWALNILQSICFVWFYYKTWYLSNLITDIPASSLTVLKLTVVT